MTYGRTVWTAINILKLKNRYKVTVLIYNISEYSVHTDKICEIEADEVDVRHTYSERLYDINVQLGTRMIQLHGEQVNWITENDDEMD